MRHEDWLDSDEEDEEDDEGEPELPPAISRYRDLVNAMSPRLDEWRRFEAAEQAQDAATTPRHLLIVARLVSRQVLIGRRALGLDR